MGIENTIIPYWVYCRLQRRICRPNSGFGGEVHKQRTRVKSKRILETFVQLENTTFTVMYVGPAVRLVGGIHCEELKTGDSFQEWPVHRNSVEKCEGVR